MSPWSKIDTRRVYDLAEAWGVLRWEARRIVRRMRARSRGARS